MHPNEVRLNKDNIPTLLQKATELGTAHQDALAEQMARQNVEFNQKSE